MCVCDAVCPRGVCGRVSSSVMCEHSCALFCFSPWLGDLENLLQRGRAAPRRTLRRKLMDLYQAVKIDNCHSSSGCLKVNPDQQGLTAKSIQVPACFSVIWMPLATWHGCRQVIDVSSPLCDHVFMRWNKLDQ